MKRFFALLMVLFLLPVVSLAEDAAMEQYVGYEQFIGRYAGNLEFINEQEGRHLISLIFSSGENEGDLRVYNLAGDVVSARLRTRGTNRQMVMLQVTLTAPQGMQAGTTEYADFVTSGYHCYALLMAMRSDDTPAERWPLIEELNNGLAGNNEYRTMVGPYNLTARRSDEGNTVTFVFSSLYWTDPLDVILPDEEEGSEEDDLTPDEAPLDEAEEDASQAG